MVRIMVSDKRKTFVAREDLMLKIGELAKQNGRSLYDTVNELFELNLLAASKGIRLRNAIEEQGVITKAKEKGLILGLESVWFDMSDLSYSHAKKEVINAWNDAGIWFGKRYTAEGIEDPFQAFKEDFELFTWNVPELAIIRRGDDVTIRAMSPKFSEAYSTLLSSFFEGVLDVLDFKVMEKELARGSMRIKAIRKYLH